MTRDEPPIATYVIEQYLPRTGEVDAAESVAALRAAAAAAGAPLPLVCSLFICDDELCLHVLVAGSTEGAAAVADAAAITPERVVMARAWLGP